MVSFVLIINPVIRGLEVSDLLSYCSLIDKNEPSDFIIPNLSYSLIFSGQIPIDSIVIVSSVKSIFITTSPSIWPFGLDSHQHFSPWIIHGAPWI